LEEKLYLCMPDKITEISAKGERHAPFSGAVSLCAGESVLFCADDSGAIWRFDRESMVEQSIGSGGPGVCDMCLSDDGERFFSLLGEADSILMSDSLSVRPLAVNRCGCNPQNISRHGDTLAVSGGESGYVYLFSVHTLECIAKIPMPGPVCSVLLGRNAIFALCRTAELNALFVIYCREQKRLFHLEGMPGSLSACGEDVLIAAQGKIHLFSQAGGCMLGVRCAPGKASRILCCLDKTFLLDPLSECLFVSEDGLLWRQACKGIRACALHRHLVQ